MCFAPIERTRWLTIKRERTMIFKRKRLGRPPNLFRLPRKRKYHPRASGRRRRHWMNAFYTLTINLLYFPLNRPSPDDFNWFRLQLATMYCVWCVACHGHMRRWPRQINLNQFTSIKIEREVDCHLSRTRKSINESDRHASSLICVFCCLIHRCKQEEEEEVERRSNQIIFIEGSVAVADVYLGSQQQKPRFANNNNNNL